MNGAFIDNIEQMLDAEGDIKLKAQMNYYKKIQEKENNAYGINITHSWHYITKDNYLWNPTKKYYVGVLLVWLMLRKKNNLSSISIFPVMSLPLVLDYVSKEAG